MSGVTFTSDPVIQDRVAPGKSGVTGVQPADLGLGPEDERVEHHQHGQVIGTGRGLPAGVRLEHGHDGRPLMLEQVADIHVRDAMASSTLAVSLSRGAVSG